MVRRKKHDHKFSISILLLCYKKMSDNNTALGLMTRIPFYKEILLEHDFNEHRICHHGSHKKQIVLNTCSSVFLLCVFLLRVHLWQLKGRM